MHGPGTTGRTLVLLEEDAGSGAASFLSDVAGLSSVSSAELAGDGTAAAEDPGNVVFEDLGVAVVDAAPDQVSALGVATAGENPILAVEAERLVYALELGVLAQRPVAGPVPAEYLRGFRDAVDFLAGAVAAPTATNGAGTVTPAAVDESRATWGLQAVGATNSTFTGQGVNVAVLDTGFDLGHPDFAGRNPLTRSFVPGEQVQDGNGHGTHCIGTSCGPRTPTVLPRYGIAFEARIHAGKVLSNRGSGSDRGILAGIEWALGAGCQVISMSLGAPTEFGQPFSQVFEAVGRRALARGTLIVAAAGNESRRPQVLKPVGHPANCPSILAVGALDSQIQVAPFSCTSDPRAGKVDIAGPGVAVYSSWPMPLRYRSISGTSMATPHVAGVAALLCQATGATGNALWGRLAQSALPLPLSSMDVGSGLVRAP
jgi:subtilisin family serine protease